MYIHAGSRSHAACHIPPRTSVGRSRRRPFLHSPLPPSLHSSTASSHLPPLNPQHHLVSWLPTPSVMSFWKCRPSLTPCSRSGHRLASNGTTKSSGISRFSYVSLTHATHATQCHYLAGTQRPQHMKTQIKQLPLGTPPTHTGLGYRTGIASKRKVTGSRGVLDPTSTASFVLLHVVYI